MMIGRLIIIKYVDDWCFFWYFCIMTKCYENKGFRRENVYNKCILGKLFWEKKLGYKNYDKGEFLFFFLELKFVLNFFKDICYIYLDECYFSLNGF